VPTEGEAPSPEDDIAAPEGRPAAGLEDEEVEEEPIPQRTAMA
jgi:hypothetical protein